MKNFFFNRPRRAWNSSETGLIYVCILFCQTPGKYHQRILMLLIADSTPLSKKNIFIYIL